MKDHTPIKRHQALVSFSRDHHFGLLLVWKIRQGLDNAIPPDRISNYVLYFFEHDLRPHFEEEEQMLFPKLPAGNAMRKRAEKEHTIIFNLIEHLQNDKSNEKLLLQFSDMLNDHIRFEERELFASLQQILSDTELGMMTTHDDKRSIQVEINWKDAFWETTKTEAAKQSQLTV